LVLLIYSGIHLSSAEQSGWSEIPHLYMVANPTSICLEATTNKSVEKFPYNLFLPIPTLKSKAFSCKLALRVLQCLDPIPGSSSPTLMYMVSDFNQETLLVSLTAFLKIHSIGALLFIPRRSSSSAHVYSLHLGTSTLPQEV
jgi:hypothetical protein